jgi:protein required for attachment to host cells
MLRVALTGAISRATTRSAVVAAPRTAGEFRKKSYCLESIL